MKTTASTTTSRTELLDSLLHSNVKRMILGALSGVLAGCVMLLVTSIVTPEGHGKLWWLQVVASVCFGGQSSAYDAPNSILIVGAIYHFAICAFLGFIFGKITTSRCLKRLAGYGLVLGGLCWLASNMFAVDIFDIHAMVAFKQWTRMLVFQSFTLSLAAFMSITSSVLDA